ncbi:hypothetical protein KJ781_04580 [Patescibacteria group bacterium]|nr:hypothetical protein [Patescibacteria group bacterium]
MVFDELMQDDLDKVRAHLQETLNPSRLPDVFWLELPADMLTPVQQEHGQSCGPHRVAVVLEEDSVRLELLVRAQESLRCACTDYATTSQREFFLGFMDRLLEETGIKT